MRFCLKHASRLPVLLAACSLIAGIVSAASIPSTPVPPRIRSVVRADAHGRLVRTVVVSPKVIPPKLVASTPAGSQTASSPEGADVPDLVEATAKRYDVDPLLVHSVIQVESNYNPYAISPKGAQGLMQLMPGTARRFGVRNSFDIKENIEGGVRYLKYLNTLFPNDPRLAIAAYNAGEGAVWKYGKTIPPYRETEQYVYRVGKKYGQSRKAAPKSKPAPPVTVTAQTAQPSEPEVTYAPVRAFIDAEGRLHLQTAPAANRATEQNP